jgi:glycine hydroxymethyltransferase
MKEDEMRLIARLISQVIKNIEDERTIEKVREQVIELCEQFPLYPELREDQNELLDSKTAHL